MEIERRERDPDTGEMAPSEASLVGEGFGDVIGKIAAKLTGKTAKKTCKQKQQKSLLKKELKKLEKKTGQLVGEKIYDKFSTKPSAASSESEPTPRNKRKRNWENACCFIPSCRSEPTRELRSRKKQISKNK